MSGPRDGSKSTWGSGQRPFSKVWPLATGPLWLLKRSVKWLHCMSVLVTSLCLALNFSDADIEFGFALNDQCIYRVQSILEGQM